MSAGTLIDEIRSAGRFLGGLRPFLKHRMDPAGATIRLDRQRTARAQTFASILERAVFENPASPYRKLFEWARITRDDVLTMLAAEGVEATLEKLYDARVSVTLEEFKGWRPIERPGLHLAVRAEDFDNPLTSNQYEARTGGSTSVPRRILVDLNLLAHESAYHAIFYAGAEATESALAIWQPAPPGAVGIKNALMQAKLGRPAARWFSQTNPLSGSLKHAVFSRATTLVAGLSGARLPMPEYTPPEHAEHVARWLAAERARVMPGILVTPASGGVRICRAAIDNGHDIAGTLFVLGGEPYTEAKAAVLAQAGSRGVCHYAMVESGLIGLACLAGQTPDDVHLVTDKIATIQRPKRVGQNGTPVGALFHTTLLPASPKVMLNVESGDYGVRVERDCGCAALPATFRSHLHTIRSYEKLTSEGMSFLGVDLLTLVEQILPSRFGGHPTDYQFVEEEHDGLPRVSLVVSRAVGELDEQQTVNAVLDFLRNRGLGENMMADVWAQSGTLHVVRRDPYVTSGGKILPLQIRGD